jgi:endonuclease/exonuclease/phosphatase family metal-dependent hydrolase
LQHYAPDVIFLQEVDEGVPRSRGHRQVDWFGDALQMPHRAYQINVHLRQGHYGNAILSRFPLTDVRRLDLSVQFKKRRGALAARCRVVSDNHQRTVILFNMHLGLAGYERMIQMGRLLRSYPFTHQWRQTALVVGGDMNDIWNVLGRRCLAPAGFRVAGLRQNTFPAVRPLRPLDRLFYRGRLNCLTCFVGHTKIARQASDHLPLVAEFELP